jgi:uncharacterized protein HemY
MPEAHYHLGEAYLRKQDFKKAQEELRVAGQAIKDALSQGNTVVPGLEKRIQSAIQKANEIERQSKGGEAVAQ